MKTTANAKTRAATKAACLALAAAALAGCEPCEGPSASAWPKARSERVGDADGREFSVVEVKGHEYVVASGVRCVSMVHAESCPCRGGAAK